MRREKLENKLLAAIRIRGRVNVRQSIAETLKRMNLNRVNNLTLIFGTKSNIGMLNKCESYITYGEINAETLKQLFEKKKIPIDDAKVQMLTGGKASAKAIGIRMPISMKPPKRGYRNIKKSYSIGGDLGYRGEEINTLIKRML